MTFFCLKIQTDTSKKESLLEQYNSHITHTQIFVHIYIYIYVSTWILQTIKSKLNILHRTDPFACQEVEYGGLVITISVWLPNWLGSFDDLWSVCTRDLRPPLKKILFSPNGIKSVSSCTQVHVSITRPRCSPITHKYLNNTISNNTQRNNAQS